MKAVLDTNVVVSGVFFGGLPGQLLSAWATGAFHLVLSEEIFEEYRRVGEEFSRGHHELEHSWKAVLNLIAVHSSFVTAPSLGGQVSDDPDDDKFLACAWASGTRVVVSGDRHLLAMSGWNGIEVLRPRQFYDGHLKRS